MWHPTKNLGKLLAGITRKSRQMVWLRCRGCIHGCGRHHERQTCGHTLTRCGGHLVCPSCKSRGRGRSSFCECQSVAEDPRLSREWHPKNPPADQVSKSSNTRFQWVCQKGHPPYKVTCNNRCTHNSGCPVCGAENRRTTHQPVLSDGRPDLAKEWDHTRNAKLPNDVTLGSNYQVWWICSSKPEHLPWHTRVSDRALADCGCPACRHMNRFKPRKFGPA